MLVQQEQKTAHSVPPKTNFLYEDFRLHEETVSYRVFEAKTRDSLQEKHLIRILDPTKDLVDKDFDSAATLFIQELFHLENRCPGTVLIGTLEICKDRKQVACALRQYGLKSVQLDQIQESIDRKNPKVIKKLISDVLSDVEFLRSQLLMKNIAIIIEPENIFYRKERGDFSLIHWEKIFQQSGVKPANLTNTTTILSVGSKLNSQVLAAEIRALAFALLKIKQVDIEELKFLLSSKIVRVSTYEHAVKSTAAEGFGDLPEIQDLIERMLSFDPKNLPSLEELHIKEAETQNSSILCPQCKKKKNNQGNGFMSVIILFKLSSLRVIHLPLIKSLKLN